MDSPLKVKNMSQNESEWKEYIQNHHDNCAECGAQTDELISFISNLLSQREKEIAEEVEKLLKEIPTQEELELTVRSITIAQEAVEFHAHNKAIKDVLQILKH